MFTYGRCNVQGVAVQPGTDRIFADHQRFPDAIPAVWSSGRNIEAICGVAFINGEQWSAMQGLLAVAALRGSKLLLMEVASDGAVTEVGQLPQLDDSYGRLRAARLGPDGALYVTTSNDDDKVLRIAPVGM